MLDDDVWLVLIRPDADLYQEYEAAECNFCVTGSEEEAKILCDNMTTNIVLKNPHIDSWECIIFEVDKAKGKCLTRKVMRKPLLALVPENEGAKDDEDE